MKKILMMLLLAVSLFASPSDKCEKDIRAVNIIRTYHIDLRTKSTKGWIRLFRNKRKYELYKISDTDRKYLIACLVEFYKSKPRVGRIL